MRTTRLRTAAALSAGILVATTGCGGSGGGGAGGEGTLRVALGDIESVETLALFVALERVEEEGVEVELIELADEDLANQAVVGGQADVGLGAPYALIQGSGAPLRIFCQLSEARFYPVVDKAAYPDWQSLDGETIAVHSRGSTSEALAKIIEQEEGIEFGEISYVSGAEVRATALVRGNLKAAVVDIPATNYVMSKSPDTFHVLDTPESDASDEVLFANTEWLEANPDVVQVLLEQVLTVWRSMSEDPQFIVDERERLDLLQDLPADLEEGMLPYYEQGADEGLFTQDCGGESAARDDFRFYGAAGQLEGDPESLEVEDFWTLEPMQAALDAVEE